MKEFIQQTIELLKLKVKTNLEEIKENQLQIKEILNQPTSAERTRLFDERYNINKRLLSENNDFINVQLTLVKFLEKYKNTPLMKDCYEAIDLSNEEEVFQHTIEGNLEYDKSHPFFTNKGFLNKLLDHYIQNEDYEKCQKLSRLINN